MSKTIKTLFMISVLLFALLQSASSSKLRSLQDETSFELGDPADTSTNPAPENDNDGTEGFELEDQGSSEPAPDNAANYDLGDADAEAAPAPTTNEATDAPLGTGVEDDNTSFTLEDGDSTSFALGDEDDTQTVTNTQANVATTTSTETSFNLGDEQPVGASVGDVLSFDLKDTDEQDTSVGTGSGSTDEASFNLDDNDDTNNVDLTDPADDESSSTDKSSSGANRGLAAGADVTVTTTTGNAKSGFSLQTGLVMSLVAVVSALVY